MKIYKLDVVVIPTNKPCVREDQEDVIYKTMQEKFDAIVEEINEISREGRPVLVGTISIEKSEALSGGPDQAVRHRARGAQRQAARPRGGDRGQGRPAAHRAATARSRGNVTIATNMAGRGTDIKLGPGVAEIGGLHILGTERHEARRIDNQLRGRVRPAGRRGVEPVLPELRRRPDAGLRPGVDGQGPVLDRVGGRPADLPQADQQGHREGPEEGRGAELRDPQEPARIRRGDGLPAKDLLLPPAQDPRGQGPQGHHQGDDRVGHPRDVLDDARPAVPATLHDRMGPGELRRGAQALGHPGRAHATRSSR